eukprot:jgi/Tetstr1/421378/TSEL_012347.t1
MLRAERVTRDSSTGVQLLSGYGNRRGYALASLLRRHPGRLAPPQRRTLCCGLAMASAEAPRRRRIVTGMVQRKAEGAGEAAWQLLLLQRSQEVRSYQGRWACVSGAVEAGEQPEAAMWREMAEETGWAAGRDLELVRAGLPIDVDDAPAGAGKVYSFRVHPFLFRLQPDTARPAPMLDWEHTGFQWLNPDALKFMEGAGETVPRLHDTLLRVWDPLAAVAGPEVLRARAAALLVDQTRGASELAHEAVALVLAGAQAESVAALRPTMVPLVNAARQAGEPGGGRVPAALDAALEEAVVAAAAALARCSSIATLSRSSSVMGAVRRLVASGDSSLHTVFVSESLPGGEGVAAAKMMAVDTGAQLLQGTRHAESGGGGNSLTVALLTDERLEQLLADGGADALVLGADAVLSDGSVVNKVGSARLARACRRATPPVALVVVADQFKTWDDTVPPCLEAAFEVVPADLVTELVGVSSPPSA